MNAVWPPASCFARRCCHRFVSASDASERSPRRSHHLQQPAGHDPRGHLQPPLAFLPHYRKDAGMSGYVQPARQYAGEFLTLFCVRVYGNAHIVLPIAKGPNGPTRRGTLSSLIMADFEVYLRKARFSQESRGFLCWRRRLQLCLCNVMYS